MTYQGLGRKKKSKHILKIGRMNIQKGLEKCARRILN
jgi:hypothetical protein